MVPELANVTDPLAAKLLHITQAAASVLLFSNFMKHFPNTLIQVWFFKIMKTNNFQDELTDMSAKTEALCSIT